MWALSHRATQWIRNSEGIMSGNLSEDPWALCIYSWPLKDYQCWASLGQSSSILTGHLDLGGTWDRQGEIDRNLSNDHWTGQNHKIGKRFHKGVSHKFCFLHMQFGFCHPGRKAIKFVAQLLAKMSVITCNDHGNCGRNRDRDRNRSRGLKSCILDCVSDCSGCAGTRECW